LRPGVTSAIGAHAGFAPIDRRNRVRMVCTSSSLATKPTWNESSSNPRWLLTRGALN